MRRLTHVLVCLALLVLAACGTSTTTTESTASAPATAPAATTAPATAMETAAAETTMAEIATAAPTMAMETATAEMMETATAGMMETATADMMETATAASGETSTAGGAGATGTLNVFAAASLTDAFGEIGEAFTAANPGTEITFNFAGSQQLAQQIDQGAPADVFASANTSQMNVAIEGGQIITGTQQTFVRNRLVVIFPTDNPGGVATLQDLAKDGLKLDLAASEVPVGQYSLDFLDKASADPTYGASFKDDVLANVVSYEENVRAVLTKVSLGEADAGIVYSSDISQDAADQVGRLDIPDDLNTIATYPIAPLQNSANPALAEQFIAFVLSPEAQAVLTKYGFIAP